MSRAIGDFEFKQNFTLQPEQQIVTADPEIMDHKLDGEEEFLVLACDGTSSSPNIHLVEIGNHLTPLRYLGLPFIAAGYRLCSQGRRKWRRAGQDLRGLDGQVSCHGL